MSALIALLLAPALFVLDGYVLKQGWVWFVTPAFGVKSPGLTIACGLVALCAFLTHQNIPRSDRDPLECIGDSLGVTLTFWGVLWLVHLCV